MRPNPVTLVLAVLSTFACGHRRVVVRIPPRLNLAQYGQVGLATFTVENAKGSLHELASRRFAEEVLAATSGIEVLELGPADSVLRRVGETQFGAASAQAVGASRGVPAVFVGHLKVSDVKPSGRVVGIRLPQVEATVTVELTVGLFSTKSGGTVWRSSAAASEKVGQLSLVDGEPSFSARDPNAAYGRLVNRLVTVVTRDLRPTWREERVR